VPQQRVSSHKQTVGLRKVYHGIASRKVELVLRWLRGIPLHAVFGRHLAEAGDDGARVLLAVEMIRVGDGAVVVFALGLEEFVDAGGLTLDRGGSDQGGRQDGGSEEGLHGE
jgi:hypothetical protein